MKHEDYSYLLYKAHLMWKLQCEAHEKGEFFEPSIHFDPIGFGGVEARAHIYRLSEEEPAKLGFVMRRKKDEYVHPKIFEELARRFFGDQPFTYVGQFAGKDGYEYETYWSPSVLKSPMPV